MDVVGYFMVGSSSQVNEPLKLEIIVLKRFSWKLNLKQATFKWWEVIPKISDSWWQFQIIFNITIISCSPWTWLLISASIELGTPLSWKGFEPNIMLLVVLFCYVFTITPTLFWLFLRIREKQRKWNQFIHVSLILLLNHLMQNKGANHFIVVFFIFVLCMHIDLICMGVTCPLLPSN